MIEHTYPEHARRMWVLPSPYMLTHAGPRPVMCVETRRYQYDPSSKITVYFAVVETGAGKQPGRETYEEVALGYDVFANRDDAFDAWGRRLELHRQECELRLSRLAESKAIAARNDEGSTP